ncbi:MAG: prolipoprotein diacylglyceryl transferase [Actinomycetota bacterium]|nr:prolipoprotein diacylglyceryl transferase [Actinomycetota bacterium]
MRPILFHIGSFPVYSYGVMLFTAFVAGIIVIRFEFKRRGLDASAVYLIAAVAAISGVIGARFFYILGHLDMFSRDWGRVFDLNMRGMVFYGGLAFAVPACIILTKRLKLPVGAVSDSVGLALPLCLAVARIGCFLNGCCGGKPSGLPWAVTFPGSAVAVHPTQLYEMALDLAVFAFLLWLRKRLTMDWDLFLISLASYGAVRFLMEFFRFHSDPRAAPLFQALSAALFAVCLVILVLRHRLKPGGKRPREETSGTC